MKYDIQTGPAVMQDRLTIMIGSLLVARIEMGSLTTSGTTRVYRAIRRASLKRKEKKFEKLEEIQSVYSPNANTNTALALSLMIIIELFADDNISRSHPWATGSNCSGARFSHVMGIY